MNKTDARAPDTFTRRKNTFFLLSSVYIRTLYNNGRKHASIIQPFYSIFYNDRDDLKHGFSKKK